MAISSEMLFRKAGCRLSAGPGSCRSTRVPSRFRSHARILCISVVCLTVLPQLCAQDRTSYFWNVHIEEGQTAGEIVCVVCSVTVDGQVTDEVVTIAGNVFVSGRVDGEVVTVGGDVVLAPGASVGDEVVVVGGRFMGSTDQADEVDESRYFHLPGQRAIHWEGLLVVILAGLLPVLLAALLLRRRTGVIAQTFISHWLAALLTGIVLFTMIWLGLELAEETGPLEDWISLVLLLILLGVPFLGATGLCLAVGQWWPGVEGKSVRTLLIGTVTVLVLLLIPVLGFPLFLTIWCLCLGLAAVSGVGSSKAWLLRWRNSNSSRETETPD